MAAGCGSGHAFGLRRPTRAPRRASWWTKTVTVEHPSTLCRRRAMPTRRGFTFLSARPRRRALASNLASDYFLDDGGAAGLTRSSLKGLAELADDDKHGLTALALDEDNVLSLGGTAGEQF